MLSFKSAMRCTVLDSIWKTLGCKFSRYWFWESWSPKSSSTMKERQRMLLTSYSKLPSFTVKMLRYYHKKSTPACVFLCLLYIDSTRKILQTQKCGSRMPETRQLTRECFSSSIRKQLLSYRKKESTTQLSILARKPSSLENFFTEEMIIFSLNFRSILRKHIKGVRKMTKPRKSSMNVSRWWMVVMVLQTTAEECQLRVNFQGISQSSLKSTHSLSTVKGLQLDQKDSQVQEWQKRKSKVKLMLCKELLWL